MAENYYDWVESNPTYEPSFKTYVCTALAWWKHAMGWWFHSAGKVAQWLADLLVWVSVSPVIATILGQVMALALFVALTHFTVGWVYIYIYISISAPCRAVLDVFPPSDKIIYSMTINLSLNTFSLFVNLFRIGLLLFSTTLLFIVYVVLFAGANPLTCFWLSQIIYLCFLLELFQ